MPKTTKLKEAVVNCVGCKERITLSGEIELGQEVICPECDNWMEVISLDPVEVDWIYEEPEAEYEEEEEKDW